MESQRAGYSWTYKFKDAIILLFCHGSDNAL